MASVTTASGDKEKDRLTDTTAVAGHEAVVRRGTNAWVQMVSLLVLGAVAIYDAQTPEGTLPYYVYGFIAAAGLSVVFKIPKVSDMIKAAVVAWAQNGKSEAKK